MDGKRCYFYHVPDIASSHALFLEGEVYRELVVVEGRNSFDEKVRVVEITCQVLSG
jgi:hypothetical protein